MLKPEEPNLPAQLNNLIIPKHTVIVRDYGSFSWLALLLPPYNLKLRVYVPHGAKFERIRGQDPKSAQFTEEHLKNLQILHYNPDDLAELMQMMRDDENQGWLHVIEYDCFVKHLEDWFVHSAKFWRRFILALITEKRAHKNTMPACLILDEWQLVSVSRGPGSTSFKELRKESEVITFNVIADAAKYRIRIIASVNPPKSMDSRWIGQFGYWAFKQLGRDAHTDDTKVVWRLTRNCAWNQVVIYHNRYPTGFNRFRFHLIPSRSDIDVDYESPKEGLLLIEEPTRGEKELKVFLRHVLAVFEYLKYKEKRTWSQMATLGDWKSTSGPAMAMRRLKKITTDIDLDQEERSQLTAIQDFLDSGKEEEASGAATPVPESTAEEPIPAEASQAKPQGRVSTEREKRKAVVEDEVFAETPG